MTPADVLDTESDVEQEPQEAETPEETTKPQKNRGGRPRGSFSSKRFKDKTPSESEPEVKQGFWDYVSFLDAVDWETHIAYAYRWAPIIDLTKGGRERKYIKVYNSAFTQETLKKEFGSGSYEIQLNKMNPKTRHDQPSKG